jgi:hypothetical protein
VLPAQANRSIGENAVLSVLNAGTDSDLPVQPLTYTLTVTQLPANIPVTGPGINNFGLITWIPTEADGPATNLFTTVVSDGNRTATNTFTVTVSELNVAPTLPPQSDRVVDEFTSLTVTNTASDADLPASTLSYTLTVTNLLNNTVVANATINANGIINWTPAESQGPSSNLFTTVVSDGTATAINTFRVTVNEVNLAPVLPPQSDLVINESTLLQVTNTATDSDVPTLPPTYTLIARRLADDTPIANATITADGIINWMTTEADGPGANRFTTIASDGALSVTNTFTVTVNEVNTAPVLPAQANRTLVGLQPLTVANGASDSDLPAALLTYQLFVTRLPENSAVANASITTGGIITWTPTANQVPSTNLFRTVVSDGQLSTTNTFTVVARIGNTPPILPVIPAQTAYEQTLLAVTNTATCENTAATLSYALANPLAGMSVSPGGIFTWTPLASQGPGPHLITTIATASDPLDPVNPQLSATNTFTVSVHPMTLRLTLSNPNTAVLSWPAPAPGWRLQESGSPAGSWVDSNLQISTVGSQNLVIIAPPAGTRFYRLHHP